MKRTKPWATGAELANFNVWGNVGGTSTIGEDAYALPRGIAFDPTDGNLWVSFETSGRCGDDVIHKIPAMGGPDIASIPNPTVSQFNNTQPYYRSIVILHTVYKLDPKSGAVLNQFEFSNGGYAISFRSAPRREAAQKRTLRSFASSIQSLRATMPSLLSSLIH
jgi:hypothetical protein